MLLGINPFIQKEVKQMMNIVITHDLPNILWAGVPFLPPNCNAPMKKAAIAK